MKNNNVNVTVTDKLLVCLIFMVVAIVSSLVTYIFMTIIHNDKHIEPSEPIVQTEEIHEEYKDEVEDLSIDSSMLPQHYILTTTSGDDTRIHKILVNNISYKEDSSYVVETSLGEEIVLKDGMGIIRKNNNLIEIFTEYSFTLENTN
jgi:hypothetical protein